MIKDTPESISHFITVIEAMVEDVQLEWTNNKEKSLVDIRKEFLERATEYTKEFLEEREMPEYNNSQLYILINALENLKISIHEPEYEFIRNNLLERFRKQLV